MRRSAELNALDGTSRPHSTQGVEFCIDEDSSREPFEFAFRPLFCEQVIPTVLAGGCRGVDNRRLWSRPGEC